MRTLNLKRCFPLIFNKSADDMRDLIGKVILENISLKRQASANKQA